MKAFHFPQCSHKILCQGQHLPCLGAYCRYTEKKKTTKNSYSHEDLSHNSVQWLLSLTRFSHSNNTEWNQRFFLAYEAYLHIWKNALSYPLFYAARLTAARLTARWTIRLVLKLEAQNSCFSCSFCICGIVGQWKWPFWVICFAD